MNLKDYQRGRNDGLALALKIVQEGGREALEAEIKNRGVTGISVNLFGEKTECLADGWVTWADICTSIQEETGIEIDFGDMFDKSKVRQEGNLS